MGGKLVNRRIALAAVSAAILGAGPSACYPGSISDIGEADLVVTVYDTAFSFAGVQTYFMPDTIIRVGAGAEDDINRSYDAEILAKVASEFAALGYQRIDENSGVAPDAFVVLGASSSTYSWWVSGGCYWCWYPGYPGWSPGWPGYPPYYPWYPVYGGSFSTGSLTILMVDPSPMMAAPEPEVRAYWGGVINGLLSSSAQNTASRVLTLIEQAFDQSPYLGGATNLPN